MGGTALTEGAGEVLHGHLQPFHLGGATQIATAMDFEDSQSGAEPVGEIAEALSLSGRLEIFEPDTSFVVVADLSHEVLVLV
jgi:hypothetical protein